MNWEKVEKDFYKWISESPETRMCSFRCFIEWLKNIEFKHLKNEKNEQENLSSTSKT
jgi:hypothetical protein